MANFMYSILSLIIFCLLLIFASCEGGVKNRQNQTKNAAKQTIITKENPLKIEITPKGKLKLGDSIKIALSVPDSLQFDSIALFINKKQSRIFPKLPNSYVWVSKNGKTGKNTIKAILYTQKNQETKTSSINLLSDIVPKTYGFKIIKTYTHDKDAYTQGLFYHNGVLYEATGLRGASSLRKVNLENGEIMQSSINENDIFGEGITLYNNKIIQLSWRAQTGFVYDKETFGLLREFNYPTEGWGITTIGDKLYMSDGTSFIYILDPESFIQIGKLQVFDNKGAVRNLNELEYIKGEIYANIYMSDKIARIDPKSGKVLAYIDLSRILTEKDKYPGIDVLNGIAWDEQNKRLFVTGKKWGKLFHIELN